MSAAELYRDAVYDGATDPTVVIAGDGTKVIASAAMHATTDEAGLTAQITDLQQQIDTTETLWRQQIAAETTNETTGAGASAHHTAALFDTPDTVGHVGPVGAVDGP